MKLNAGTALLVLTGAALSAQPALSQSPTGGTKAGTAASGSASGQTRATDPVPGVHVMNGLATTKQEPSKAPLPPGYVYDANGRIVMDGTSASRGHNSAFDKPSISTTPDIKDEMVRELKK